MISIGPSLSALSNPFPTSVRLAASDHSSPTKLNSLASRCTCRDMRSTKSASVAQPSWRQ